MTLSHRSYSPSLNLWARMSPFASTKYIAGQYSLLNAPYRVTVIHRDRIFDVHALGRSPDVVNVRLEFELRCVHTDQHQPWSLYFLFHARREGSVRRQLIQE